MDLSKTESLTAIAVALLTIFGGGWRAWNALLEKINGLGGRIDTERARISTAELVIAENKVRIDTLREDVSDDNRALMTQMFNNEQAAAERHRILSVEIAKLQTMIDIRNIVKDTVNELRKTNNG